MTDNALATQLNDECLIEGAARRRHNARMRARARAARAEARWFFWNRVVIALRRCWTGTP